MSGWGSCCVTRRSWSLQLTKNFGLTRNGRVVFYDYDEVCLLTKCNFRKIPDTGDDDDYLAAEPWYGVNPNDVFPEEFVHFLGLTKDLKQAQRLFRLAAKQGFALAKSQLK